MSALVKQIRCALLWLLLSALLSAAGDEGTCVAGSTSPSCLRISSSSSGSSGALGSAIVRVPRRTEDMLVQEVEELEAAAKLNTERIQLLKELQAAARSGADSISLPEAHVRALSEKLPMLSEAADPMGPSAAAEDYVIFKAVIPQEQEVVFLKFMSLRTPRASSSSSSSSSSAQSSMPSALLVAAQADGTVRFFTPSGELALTFSAGHEHAVTNLAVAPGHDEYLLATADASGVIRAHRITVRQRRLTKEQKFARRNSSTEKISQFLGLQMNVSAQLFRQMQVPAGSDGETPQLTSLAVASQQGSKFFVAGDVEGKISVFTKNGTFRGKIDATMVPGAGVEGLDVALNNLLFFAGEEWGYVELEKLEVRRVDCPRFEGRTAAATIDSQQASRVLVADEQGSVWVFSVKNKRECKLEMQFARGSTRAPIELASIRGFVLGLERPAKGEAAVLALNMSVAASKGPGEIAGSPVVWRKSRQEVRAWAVQKRFQQGDLIAFLSGDGLEIEIVELLMQVYTAPQTDNFGNFKLPVIAVAIILVLGYQFIKQKGKFSGSGGGGLGGKKFGGDDFAAALRNKKRLAGMKGKKL